MSQGYKPIEFPADESVHHSIVEWWYFNGRLRDDDGNEYSFMNCLFRVDVRRIKIPFLSKVFPRVSYFSHSLITDLSNKKFYHRLAPFSVVSKDSFSKPLLYINYFNPNIKKGRSECLIEKVAESRYCIKNEDIDLALISTKSPLFEGGNGYLDLYSKTTYYYSLTNLKTEGRIRIKGKWLDVVGKSWMDHQWSDAKYPLDRWDWFSIQLDGDIEIVCFVYDDGKRKTYSADISYADGRQEHFREVKIAPLEKYWTSSKSQAVYPVAWKVEIPEKDIKLELAAEVDSQEMLSGSINYWEGSLCVEGSFGSEPVKGYGFMELVGYPSQYSDIRYINDGIIGIARRLASIAKDKATAMAKAIKKKMAR